MATKRLYEIHQLDTRDENEKWVFVEFTKGTSLLSALEAKFGARKVKSKYDASFAKVFFVTYKPWLEVCAFDHARRVARLKKEEEKREQALQKEKEEKENSLVIIDNETDEGKKDILLLERKVEAIEENIKLMDETTEENDLVSLLENTNKILLDEVI